jgi:hypothetical protein
MKNACQGFNLGGISITSRITHYLVIGSSIKNPITFRFLVRIFKASLIYDNVNSSSFEEGTLPSLLIGMSKVLLLFVESKSYSLFLRKSSIEFLSLVIEVLAANSDFLPLLESSTIKRM